MRTCGKSGPPRRSCAVLFHHGAPHIGGTRLGTAAGVAALRAAARACSPAGQLQVTVALESLEQADRRLHQVRRQLLEAARHLAGARELHARLYGVGPVTALALTCWLAGKGRFSSARKAVRFAGLDVTVYSSAGKRAPGHLSRQGPEMRWCLYEAGKTHAHKGAPGHPYYAQVKDRIDGKRAALSQARRILREAVHILDGLGDDALAAC
jgi:transposase